MGFDQHCIVELMGHQRISGLVTEQEISGHAFIRVDVPEVDGMAAFTKFYSPDAIYSITPVDETTCLAAVRRDQIRPIETWGMHSSNPELTERVKVENPDPDDYYEDW